MRDIESVCFLCEIRQADKKNSHIFPKFITKSILGTGKGYQIDAQKSDKHPKILQDTPKEDYILCNLCEKFFEILETYVATRMHNRIKDIRYSSEFIDKIENNKVYKQCRILENVVMRLFIYSIIFRSHITSHEMFNKFAFPEHTFAKIKAILLSYISCSQTELMANISEQTYIFNDLIFALLTSDNTGDDTENFLFIHPFLENPYFFVMNKYLLVFSFQKSNKQDEFGIWNNQSDEPIKIGFMSPDEWIQIKKSFISLLSTVSTDMLTREGKVPYQGK